MPAASMMSGAATSAGAIASVGFAGWRPRGEEAAAGRRGSARHHRSRGVRGRTGRQWGRRPTARSVGPARLEGLAGARLSIRCLAASQHDGQRAEQEDAATDDEQAVDPAHRRDTAPTAGPDRARGVERQVHQVERRRPSFRRELGGKQAEDHRTHRGRRRTEDRPRATPASRRCRPAASGTGRRPRR